MCPLIVPAGPFGAALVLSLMPPPLELITHVAWRDRLVLAGSEVVPAMLAGYLAGAVEAALAAIELTKRLEGSGA